MCFLILFFCIRNLKHSVMRRSQSGTDSSGLLPLVKTVKSCAWKNSMSTCWLSLGSWEWVGVPCELLPPGVWWSLGRGDRPDPWELAGNEMFQKWSTMNISALKLPDLLFLVRFNVKKTELKNKRVSNNFPSFLTLDVRRNSTSTFVRTFWFSEESVSFRIRLKS